MRQLWYPRSFHYVARLGPIELGPAAHNRLRWLKAWQRLRQRGSSGQAAAEILRLPRATLYRWQRRLEHEGLKGLEERSRRPKRVRRPQWSPELAQAVLRLREQYPAWGKETLQVLLEREGWKTSASTVGRILAQLKARGVLREAPRHPVSVRHWRTGATARPITRVWR